MNRPPARAYRFLTAAQWRGGAIDGFAIDGFAIDGDTLTGSAPLTVRKLIGLSNGALAGADGCGRIRRLVPATGEVSTLYRFGVEIDGTLAIEETPIALVVGARWLWVAFADSVRRYDTTSLQLVGELRIPGIGTLAGDGGDGVWVLSIAGGNATLRHVDAWGRPAGKTIPIDGPLTSASLAAQPGGGWLAAIAGDNTGSRLIIVDPATCAVERAEPIDHAGPACVSIDARGVVHVAVAPDLLLGFDRGGALIAHQRLPLPASALPIAGLFDQQGLVIVGADGLYRIEAAPRGDAAVMSTTATYVTPPLISPIGVPGGWNRADIDMLLPVGASLTVSVAASDSAPLIDAIADRFAATATTPATRLAAIEGLIPWQTGRDRRYAGTGARTCLRFLLDDLPQTHLWLRLDCSVPAGADPPTLHGLRVGYPDASWIDELPALYREDAEGAMQLRRFLAPLEALFDDIDTRIGGLAAQIDPATAPADRLPFLLSWLGLPPLTGLSAAIQRALLEQAGDLLTRRGTLGALREVLAIVTEGNAQVEDGAMAAFLWVLGGPPAGMRLGRDTRVVAGRPTAFILGAVTLGASPIGRGNCTDLGAIARGACAVVTVRIAVDPPARRTLEPAIRAVLGIFVPAHCRVDLRFVPPGTPPREDRLDADLTLADGAGGALGATSRIGGWRLAADDPALFPLDATATIGGGQLLA